MHQVTRTFVWDDLDKNPNLTYEELRNKYPLANEEEITEGIKLHKEHAEIEGE